MKWVIIGAILAALWAITVPLVVFMLIRLARKRVLRELETRVLDIAAPRLLDLKYDDGRVTQQCCAECGGPVLDKCVEHRSYCPGLKRFLEIRKEFEKAKGEYKR